MKLKYIALLSIFFSMQAAVEQGFVDSDGCVIIAKDQWVGGLLDWYNCKVTSLKIHKENFFPIKIYGELWYGWPGNREKKNDFENIIQCGDDLKSFFYKVKKRPTLDIESIIAQFLTPLLWRIIKVWNVEHKKIFPIIVIQPDLVPNEFYYEIFLNNGDIDNKINAFSQELKKCRYRNDALFGTEKLLNTIKLIKTDIEMIRRAGWQD